MNSTSHIKFLVLTVLCVIAAGGLATGCGNGEQDTSPPPDYAKKLAGSPPELAAIHDQADQLLPGGLDAYDQRIEDLQGFPVVVNVWASWCGPCRAEFPFFQQLSAELGRKVAFLGVNSEDSDDAAATFLSENQLSYPSYTDPDKDIANDVGGLGFPRTVFYDSSGEMTFVHSGQFPDQASLEEAIQEYAVQGRSG